VSAAIRDGARRRASPCSRWTPRWTTGPSSPPRRLPSAGRHRGGVTARLADVGADLLLRTIAGWVAGEIVPVEQDHARATYVRKLSKDEGVVDFNRSVVEVKDHIRAMSPWPLASTRWMSPSGREPFPLVLHRAIVLEGATVPEGTPQGTVLAAGKDGIDVACNDGVLRVVRLQAPGGKPMSAREFLNAARSRRTTGSGNRRVAGLAAVRGRQARSSRGRGASCPCGLDVLVALDFSQGPARVLRQCRVWRRQRPHLLHVVEWIPASSRHARRPVNPTLRALRCEQRQLQASARCVASPRPSTSGARSSRWPAARRRADHCTINRPGLTHPSGRADRVLNRSP
jgi:hypothetical protein